MFLSIYRNVYLLSRVYVIFERLYNTDMYCNIQNFTVSMVSPSKITGRWPYPYRGFEIQVGEQIYIEVCLVPLATTPNFAWVVKFYFFNTGSIYSVWNYALPLHV
jgi:hypothetical protein